MKTKHSYYFKGRQIWSFIYHLLAGRRTCGRRPEKWQFLYFGSPLMTKHATNLTYNWKLCLFQKVEKLSILMPTLLKTNAKWDNLHTTSLFKTSLQLYKKNCFWFMNYTLKLLIFILNLSFVFNNQMVFKTINGI